MWNVREDKHILGKKKPWQILRERNHAEYFYLTAIELK